MVRGSLIVVTGVWFGLSLVDPARVMAQVANDGGVAAVGADWQALQTLMAHVGQDVDYYSRNVQKQLSDDEAQKATLIEWLKAAQEEAKAAKSKDEP